MKKFLSVVLAAAGAFSVFADVPTAAEGWKLLSAGKFEECEKLFRTIYTQGSEKDKFIGMTGIMFALRRQNKNADVIKDADAWLNANPNAPAYQRASIMQFKGNAQRDLGKTEDALATYKQGVDLKSTGSASGDCARMHIALAVNSGKFDLAKQMYAEASKQPECMKNVGFLLSGANMMWKTNNPEEGLKLLDMVEKRKHPQHLDEEIHRTRGYFYRDGLKKYDEAVKSFEKALAVPGISATQKAVLWNNIGMAYERDEEYEKAVEAFKKVGTFNAKGWFIKSAANSAIRLQKKIDAGE